LKHLGFTILPESTEAIVRVHQKTLFYMPHSNYGLTDNLIYANSDSLHHVAILGNNLAWVCDPDATNITAADNAKRNTSRAPCVQEVLSLVKETHLEDTMVRKAKSQLASLAPRISKALVSSICDTLDCTLSTFPLKISTGDIKRPYEPSKMPRAEVKVKSLSEPYLESAL